VLSHLDRVLYPTRCEVIEIVPSQRYVFPIFKNGSTSLYDWSKENRTKILFNEQIKKILTIDVILRDPKDRLISGINSFIHYVLRDNPELDRKTVTWFATNYFYLDRHYSSQLSWLVALARYLDSNSRLTFLPMSAVQDIANTHRSPVDVGKVTHELETVISSIEICKMYQRLDMVLYTLIGQSLTWLQVLEHLQQQDADAYDFVVTYAKKIIEPLYVLS